MAKYYQKYHDVVFMDATYNTNKHNLALAIISGISSEGKNIIMGRAFLAREKYCVFEVAFASYFYLPFDKETLHFKEVSSNKRATILNACQV